MPKTTEQPRVRFSDEKLREIRAAIVEVGRIQDDVAGLDAHMPDNPVHEAFTTINAYLTALHNNHA